MDEKLDIDIPLGSLANIKSGSNIAIRGNGTIQMKVGLDLKPLGARLNLGPLTKLSELHDGKNPLAYDVQGQTQSYNVDGQNDLRITLSNGQPFEINFDSLHPATATIQSVIDLIALTVPPSLMEIEINQRLGRLELIDKSNGQANAFKVEGINGSLIGGPNGLGLYGEAGNPDENGLLRITGSALHGESIRDHIFIPTDPLNVPRITLEATVTGRNLQASADFGFVNVGIIGGTLDVSAKADARLRDPGTGVHDDDRITMTEFMAGIKIPSEPGSIINTIEYPVSANLTLPIDAQMDGSLFANGGGHHRPSSSIGLMHSILRRLTSVSRGFLRADQLRQDGPRTHLRLHYRRA